MEKEDIIKKTIKELLNIIGFDNEVVVDNSDENNILVNIQTNQAGFLIGQTGANLDALQHIARVLVNKQSNQSVQFILDVNSYRRHRIELLKELAVNIAKQAQSERVAITLQPMSAFERRIIHLALTEYSQISTESIGQEPERRVIVKMISDK